MLKKIENLVNIFKFAENISQDKTCSNCYSRQGAMGEMCVRWISEAVGWQWVEMPLCNTCENWKKA